MKTGISLRTKFSAIITGIIVLLGISIVWFIRTSVHNHLVAEMQKRAEVVALNIASDSVNPILTKDFFILQELVIDRTKLQEDIFYVFITDPDGNILTHSFGAKFPTDLMKPSIVANVGTGRTTRLETNKGEVFDVSSPVLRGQAGAVHVGILGKPIEAKVSAIVWRIVWIIVGILALGYVLALYFVSFIVKPIRELTRAAEALGRGDLTQRAHVASHDETGVLADAFNEMAEDLMHTTTSITNLNAEIAARTQAEDALLKSQRDLSVKNRIAEIFLTIPDDGMYTDILSLILELLESEFGLFGYLDDQGAFIVPTMTRHIWDKCQIPDKTFVFPRDTWGDSTWAQAIRQKRTIYSNEPSTNIPEGHIGIQRHISMPILFRGKVIAHFAVANKATDYADEDLALLQMIADNVAPVLYARLQGDKEEKKRREAEEEREVFLHDMGERNKELTCMYTAAKAIQGRKTVAEILQDVADGIPDGWHYPEITRGKVRFGSAEFVSEPFEETQWKQTADIVVNGKCCGSIEVYYLKECPELDEGPFMAEERNLIDGLGRAVSEGIARKEAQEALKESEARYRSLTDDVLDSSGLGLFILDADIKVVWINHAIERFFGVQRDQVIGKDKRELIRTQISSIFEDPQEFIDKVIPTYDNNTYMEKFECHVLSDGTRRERWLEHRSLPIQSGLYAGGRMEHYIDVTERKRAEERIADVARFPSENPEPVLRIARDGTLLYANDASASILEKWGCREGEAVPDEWRGIISEVFDTGRVKKTEREHARRFLSFSIAPVIEAGYANIYCTDTTERKRAEESLKLRLDLEELLTSISTDFIGPEPDEIDDGIDRAMKSIIDAICVDRGYIFLYSADGRTMDNTHEICRPGVPPYKERLHDVPVEKFPWFDRKIKKFEPVIIDSVAGLTEEAAAEKEKLQYEDIQSLLCMPMVSRGGLLGFVGFDTVLYEVKWAEETMTFVRILGTVFANAIERKRSGQERERLLKTLAAKNEELQGIVYVASHDLKSPLVNIQGFSGELSRTCEQIDKVLRSAEVPADVQKQLAHLLDEDIPESITFIRAGTVKMQALLNGLLEVCRVGSAVLQIQALDMNQMIKRIIASMQFQITESGTDLTVDDLPGCIGDCDHVNQVFSNLLANAVKYLDPERKGDIHISGRVENGKSIYCVHDNGLGIAPQHQKKVFEIFHRLEPDRHAEGEGLGLTIALRILERHEGRIWMESEPGKGSKFFISLPTA